MRTENSSTVLCIVMVDGSHTQCAIDHLRTIYPNVIFCPYHLLGTLPGEQSVQKIIVLDLEATKEFHTVPATESIGQCLIKNRPLKSTTDIYLLVSDTHSENSLFLNAKSLSAYFYEQAHLEIRIHTVAHPSYQTTWIACSKEKWQVYGVCATEHKRLKEAIFQNILSDVPDPDYMAYRNFLNKVLLWEGKNIFDYLNQPSCTVEYQQPPPQHKL